MKLRLELLTDTEKPLGTVGSAGRVHEHLALAAGGHGGVPGAAGEGGALLPTHPNIPQQPVLVKASRGAASPASPPSPVDTALVPANDATACPAVGPFVLDYEIDGQCATCIDPVSQTLAQALADLEALYGERLGRVWRRGELVRRLPVHADKYPDFPNDLGLQNALENPQYR